MKKIYLAWQIFENETRHLRRLSVDGKFQGYQKQDKAALNWVKERGDPEWPCNFDLSVTPFEIIQQ